MKKRRFFSGFTLIELLVVITLISLLMGLALVSYQGTRRSARDGRRKADLEQIRNALEMCRADANSYPSSLGTSIICDGQTYMASVPTDPLLSTYNYRYNGVDANTYVLCAYLEGGTEATDCSGSCGGDCGVGVTCNYKTCNP